MKNSIIGNNGNAVVLPSADFTAKEIINTTITMLPRIPKVGPIAFLSSLFLPILVTILLPKIARRIVMSRVTAKAARTALA